MPQIKKSGPSTKQGGYTRVGSLFSTKKAGLLVGTIKDQGEYKSFSNLLDLLKEADPTVGVTLFCHRNQEGGERAPKIHITARIAEEYNPGRGGGRKPQNNSSEDDYF